MAAITVRDRHGDLPDIIIERSECSDEVDRIRDQVEDRLPLGLSVSTLSVKGELLASTVLVCEVRGRLIWMKTKAQQPERYVTQWNGLSSFLVEILCRQRLHRVRVFPSFEMLGWEHCYHDGDEDESSDEQILSPWKRRRLQSDEETRDLGYSKVAADFDRWPVLDMEVEDLFIGRSELEDSTWRSRGFGRSFDGNSILLKKCKNEYILLGKEMFAFSTQAEILKFAAPMGNSLVPYSYAVDEDGRHYLFTEKVILEMVHDTKPNPRDVLGPFNPYWYIYEDLAYDKCKFQLRYCGITLKFTHPDSLHFLRLRANQVMRYEKLVNGKAERITADKFQRLVTKWFNAHGISQLKGEIIPVAGRN